MSQKLSVLQIIPHLDTGGAEVGCLALAKALVGKGHRSIIATHSGRMVAHAIAAGIEILTLPVHSKSPLQIARNAALLKSFVLAESIDVLHVRSRAPAWSTSWLAKATCTPWVSTYHGTYKQQNLLKKKYNGIMTKADRIIAPSQFISNHLDKHYPECAAKVITIPRGIDLTIMHPPSSYQAEKRELARFWEVSDQQRMILLPARITRLKGHHVCIAAVNKIKDFLRDNHVQILFVGSTGSDAYLSELKQDITNASLQDLIRFYDHCPHMQHAYALAELVLVCSTQAESFGRIAVEAQAMGKGIIATDHGGCRETIKHGKTGWLVPPNDPTALAERIKHALSLPSDQLLSMAKEAQSWVTSAFDQIRMIDQTVAIYQSLCQKHD